MKRLVVPKEVLSNLRSGNWLDLEYETEDVKYLAFLVEKDIKTSELEFRDVSDKDWVPHPGFRMPLGSPEKPTGELE